MKPVNPKDNLLISLAFLKVYSDTLKKSYLDTFVPFLVECFLEDKEEIISLENTQESFNNLFGIQIPQHVLKKMLQKAKRLNLIRLENHIFYKNFDELNKTNFSSEKSKVEKCYTELISDFQDFSKKEFNVTLNDSNAEKIILSFINYNQVFLSGFNKDNEIVPSLPNLSEKEKIIFKKYIEEVQSSNQRIYEILATIVQGFMIANSIYFEDPNFESKKFRKTKIIFDTSFIIFALGYAGNEIKAPCEELLELLFINGAQLFCFTHTVEEIKGILYACIHKLGKPDETTFGRSVTYFTSRGLSPTDIELLISSIERNIETLRIRIIRKPDYSHQQYVIDEKELTTMILERVSSKQEAVLRDVDSLSAIYRIRKGNSTYSIEDCDAIFITTNNSLAKVSNEFYFKDHEEKTIPPCITDFTLTNIIWLKSPTKAPNLPMKRIIADCYAAVQPSDRLMKKWIDEITKLKTNNDLSISDYYFMRYSEEARSALMEITLGEIDAITEGSISEILHRAKEKIFADEQDKLDREIILRKYSESELIKLKIEKENETIKIDESLKKRARKIALIFTDFLKICISGLLGIVTFLFSPLPGLIGFKLIEISNMKLQWFLFILFLFAFIFNLINLIFGISVISAFNSLEVNLEKKIYQYLKNILYK